MSEPPPNPEDEIPPQALALLATVVYGILVCVAVFWFWIRERQHRLPELAVGDSLGASVAVGLAVGLGVSGLFWLAVRYLAPFRGLEDRLRALVGPLHESEILVIAMASAVGEEMLFRGAIQDQFGLLPTAVIFCLLHIGPGLWLWTGVAAAMGLVFGWMIECGFGLLSVTLAHALINFISLRRMALPRTAET